MQGDVAEAHARMRDAYWKHKDIDGVVRLADQAFQTTDVADTAVGVVLKAIAYDLGSFTWPGWDEPGIRLEAAHRAAGLAAARRNLVLAHQLERPPLAMSRAHWLLGAHLWAAGNVADARSELAEAERLAEHAGVTAETLLYRAYREHLTPGADRAVTLDALSRVEGGNEFVRQVETAHRILTG